MENIILYNTEDGKTSVKLYAENNTVWLTQAQMAELFNTTKQNISLHIKNIFKDDELSPVSTVKEYLTVQIEGRRKIQRQTTGAMLPTKSFWITKCPCSSRTAGIPAPQ